MTPAHEVPVPSLPSTEPTRVGDSTRGQQLCCCSAGATLLLLLVNCQVIAADKQSVCCMQDAAPCSGELLESIKAKWGSLDNFISTFNATTAAVQVGA